VTTPPARTDVKTFQVPVRDIADLTGLAMPVLLDADVVQPVGTGAAARQDDSSIPLQTTTDIRLP
jgi:hypothetical protein